MPNSRFLGTNRLQTRAFTLIELLVVIAIIAILAAILFPVFAQAKAAAKQTADISQLKQINMANQIYMNDFDDTWVPWTSGANCFYGPCAIQGTDVNFDDGSPFGLRYMYPQTLNPYIKSGIKAGGSSLNDIWASPLSKGYFPNTKYLYAYNYYTLGGFSGCMASNYAAAHPTGSCIVGRNAGTWGDFADLGYNTPAASTSISSPATTVAFMDGNILARPPQAWNVWGGYLPEYVVFFGVWGPRNPGSGTINGVSAAQNVIKYNADNGCPCPAARDNLTAADYQLVTGDKTVVSYTDSHVKLVPTSSLYSNHVTTDKWTGALSDNTGWKR